MKFNRLALTTALAAITPVLLISAAGAAPIAVPNYSFESGLTGWTNTAEGTAGTATPNDVPSEDGASSAYVYGNNDGLAETFSSSASLATIAANTTYTLTVYVAEPSLAQASGNTYVQNASGTAGTANIALLANGLSFASQTGILSVGSFTQETLTFTTGSSDSIIGQNLTIQLGGDAFTGRDGAGGFPNVYFDNVALDASGVSTSVPEPSSMALLLGGLGVLGIMARRRHQQS